MTKSLLKKNILLLNISIDNFLYKKIEYKNVCLKHFSNHN